MKLELIKLWRPAVMAVTLVSAGVIALMFAAYQDSAEVQRQSAINDYRVLQEEGFDDSMCKEFYGLAPGRACAQARDDELSSAESWVERSRGVYPFAHVQQSPAGIFGIVAGHLASLLGVIVTGIIAAVHVGGEWPTGTIKPVLARYGRGPFFVTSKAGSIILASGVALAVISILLVAALPLTRALYSEIHPAPADYSAFGYAMEAMVRVPVVVLFFASIATLAAVLTRSPIGCLGTTLGVAVALQVASAFGFAETPGVWVAQWMGFSHKGQFADHLWMDVPAGAQAGVGEARYAVLLVLFAAGALLMAAARVKWGDAGG